MWMAWGPELTFFANDKYVRDTLGAKFPWALGKPASSVWEEIWPEIHPRIQTVMQTGAASWDESLLLFLERSGYREETYHTFSYSPLTDESGRIAGMLCVVSEDTARVIGEQRMAILGALGSGLTGARTEEEVFEILRRELRANDRTVPFGLVYLLEGDEVRLVCCAGADPGDPVAPAAVSVSADGWPFDRVAAGEAVLVEGLSRRFDRVPRGGWDEPATSALVVPLLAQPGERPYGALVAGLNRYLAFDGAYESFLTLLASQVAASLGNARAYAAERDRAEGLAELDRAKTAFFTNVSHEFRTPLTLILAPTEDALEDRTAPLASVQRERLELVRRNALRMRRLVNDLLDVSRIDGSALAAELEATDLAALTREIAASFAPAVQAAGVELTLGVQDIGRPAFVDREMWQRIVLNLLSNALKHTLQGEIRLSLAADGELAELKVSDTGVGIPGAEIPNLFQRFHSIRIPGSRSYEGTGIGLVLVKELAALHGGEVDASSELGKGSTFTVRIPLGHASARPVAQRVARSADVEYLLDDPWADEPPAGTQAAGPKGGSVVVVDDNADMRRLLVSLLSPHWEVRACADGAEALEAVRQAVPDLVLTDVMMPNVGGFELLRRLRDNPDTAAVSVVFISARAGEGSSVEGFEAGADDYLVKPFASAELIARVRAHVQRAQLQREERESRQHAELLERIAYRMSSASSRAEVSEIAVAELCTQGIDVAALMMLQGEESLELLASQGLHPDSVRESRILRREIGGTVAEAVEQDTLVYLATGAEYDQRYPRTAVRRQRDELESLVATPLHTATGEVVGALWAASREPGWLTPHRRSLMSGLAEQIGSALERARLDETLIARERSARMLAHLTESLERSTYLVPRAEAAVTLLVEELVPFASVHTLEGDALNLTASASRDGTHDGETVLAARQAVAAGVPARAEGPDGSAVLALPLRARGTTIGALSVVPEGATGSSELAHLEDVADRIAVSIDNAFLYERERSISHRLQLGLLGEELPPLADVEVLPAYRPGTATLEVGGDWYDAFALPGGRVALVVGDVVGHGLDAAITMGQLRGAVRALAPLGGPAQLLGHLDEFSGLISGASSATLAYAELDASRTRLRYACAGHPPPFVLARDGSSRYLWEGRSAPIASGLVTSREEASATIDDGDTLGLYTDGLVERRGAPLEGRLEQLLATATSLGNAPLEKLSDLVLDTMLRPNPTDDDACLLLVRPTAPKLRARITADPGELPGVRHSLRAWLTRIVPDDEVRQEILLAAGEAMTNAVEHAYVGRPPGEVVLVAQLERNRIVLTVSDQGRWRTSSSGTGRGRGRLVMQKLMDDVAETTGPDGTIVEMHRAVS
jgi:signal transduction histidine kinase/DNA-binding response OmpR family regulator